MRYVDDLGLPTVLIFPDCTEFIDTTWKWRLAPPISGKHKIIDAFCSVINTDSQKLGSQICWYCSGKGH